MGSPQEEVDQLIKEGEHAMKADSFAVYIECIRAEAPKHHVKLTKAFYFGACPVTQAESSWSWAPIRANPRRNKIRWTE